MKWVCLLAVTLVQVLFAQTAFARCLDDGRVCSGCGCKGGPGYRSYVTEDCVGYRDLYKVCGDPHATCCAYEGAPGTGENRDCALDAVAVKLFQLDGDQPLSHEQAEAWRKRVFEELRQKALETGLCPISE